MVEEVRLDQEGIEGCRIGVGEPRYTQEWEGAAFVESEAAGAVRPWSKLLTLQFSLAQFQADVECFPKELGEQWGVVSLLRAPYVWLAWKGQRPRR
jgi:hypothetical protein